MIGELLGFTLGDHHSSEFNLVRTQKGLSSKDLFGKFQDSTKTIENSDITIYYNSFFQSKTFSLQTAFVDVKENDLAQLKIIWNTDKLYPLIFDEAPHKYYMVKVDKITTIKHLAFENDKERYYNGEITFSFTSYFPYALSRFPSIEQAQQVLPSELQGFWEDLEDIPESEPVFQIVNNSCELDIYNYGDLPAIFSLWINLVTPRTTDENGIIDLEKRIRFKAALKARSSGKEYILNFNGVTQNSISQDTHLCMDAFRGTILGYKGDPKICSKVLYNGTTTGEFPIIPPQALSHISFILLEGEIYDGNNNKIRDLTIEDLNLQYEIKYIYRE